MVKENIVMVLPRFPFPLNKGDKLRAYNHLKILSENYNVHLFVLNDETNINLKPIENFTKSITVFNLKKFRFLLFVFKFIFSSKPLQNIYYEDNKALKNLNKLINDTQPSFIFFQLSRLNYYFQNVSHNRKYVDLMDCFSYHYFIKAKSTKNFLLKQFWLIETVRIRKVERVLQYNAKNCFIISKKDKQLLPPPKQKVIVSKNGIDVVHAQTEIKADSKKDYDLIFFGNLQYEPNLKAIKFIVNEILPEARKLGFEPKLLVGGSDAVESLKKLLKKNKIDLIENPADRLEVLKKGKVFIAPMFWNSGVQNKILEAIMANLIVVCSANAAEAIELKDHYEVFVCNTPKNYAETIKKILNSCYDLEKINEKAHYFVEINHNWNLIGKQLIESFN